MAKVGITDRSPLPAASRLLHLSASLIGVALFIDLAANRWGAYLISPIPGLFLPEFLIAVSAILTMFWCWRHRFRISKRSFALILLPALPLMWMLPRWLFARSTTDSISLLIRDIAPFAYLILVPIMAIPLSAVPAHVALNVVRVSTATLAAGVASVQFGWIAPTPSPLTGSSHVDLFQYRPDLASVGLALAVVAWGPWPARRDLKFVPVQFLMVGIAALSVDSRIGLVCLAAALLVLPFQYRAWLPSISILVVSVLLFASIFVFRASLTDSHSRPADQAAVWEVAAPRAQQSSDLFAGGPVRARFETWLLVVNGMVAQQTIWLGGNLGTNYLFQLCTGESEIPNVVTASDNKCPVDDAGPEPVVRDPHNWFLNLTLSAGVFGGILWLLFVVVVSIKARGCDLWGLAVTTICLFLLLGTTSVISGGYALVPISVALSWLFSHIVFGKSLPASSA